MIATALDPRFKCKSTENPIIKKIRDILPKDQTQEEPQPTPAWQKKVKESSYWSGWEETTENEEPLCSADIELQYYVKMPNLPRTNDPLLWWKAQSHALPLLSSWQKSTWQFQLLQYQVRGYFPRPER